MNETARPGRSAEIVATLGPASSSPETLDALIEAGMDVARLNFSHMSHEDVGTLVERLRRLVHARATRVATLGDLQGTKLRVGELPQDLELAEGTALTLTAEAGHRGPNVVSVDEAALGDAVVAGTRVYLKDGTIELEVTSRSGSRLETIVRSAGTLTSRAGLNIPDVALRLPALTEQDRADLVFAVAQGISWLALSFVSGPDDISQARALLAEVGAPQIRLVAKIERAAALEQIDAIAEVSDVLMVARGDLGVEIGVEEVPIWQHRIIASGERQGVPVIVATEMLESMRTNERPTRAEASDVAHAVWDGAAALMLSAETAVGQYPVAAVATMDRIIRRAEAEAGKPKDEGVR